MKICIRFAKTESDYKASYQLRYKIYVEEMGRLKHDSNVNQRELSDERDLTARILIATKGSNVIGTMRILWGGDTTFDQQQIKTYHMAPFLSELQNQEICIIERLMIDKNYRGSSTMLRMYKEALHFVNINKIELMLLASEPQHIRHYQRLGAHVFAKTRLYEGIGPVVPMAQAMGDYNHQKTMQSPFSMLTKESDWHHFNKTENINRIINNEKNKITTSRAKTPNIHSERIAPISKLTTAHCADRLMLRIG